MAISGGPLCSDSDWPFCLCPQFLYDITGFVCFRLVVSFCWSSAVFKRPAHLCCCQTPNHFPIPPLPSEMAANVWFPLVSPCPSS
ncbi:hypothetical protein AALO_G00035770 [Alosa alosa]|uniref:Uncharacterized protein n=1 Tax=Alosa alosa TaxID=278164 RepID=A0AAV6H6N1_9TELE|nr:hypothetical protein AALO_G00035770 [Alosa alosa]